MFEKKKIIIIWIFVCSTGKCEQFIDEYDLKIIVYVVNTSILANFNIMIFLLSFVIVI